LQYLAFDEVPKRWHRDPVLAKFLAVVAGEGEDGLAVPQPSFQGVLHERPYSPF
jgi:hypothetical protein